MVCVRALNIVYVSIVLYLLQYMLASCESVVVQRVFISSVNMLCCSYSPITLVFCSGYSVLVEFSYASVRSELLTSIGCRQSVVSCQL